MERTVQDTEGTKWTCLQAYAGLSDEETKRDAARVEGTEDRYQVVCTPSGGSQSVRLELPRDWESTLTDEELLARIERARR